MHLPVQVEVAQIDSHFHHQAFFVLEGLLGVMLKLLAQHSYIYCVNRAVEQQVA